MRLASPGTTTSARARTTVLPTLLVAVVSALILLPATHTGFRFDDSSTYDLRTGLLQSHGWSFWHYVAIQLAELFRHGRVQPMGAVLIVIPWVFSGHPTAYKGYLIATSVLATLLVARLLTRLGVPKAVSLAVALLSAAFIQFRFYHDALLGYGGVMQLSVSLLATGLLAWLRYQATRRRAWVAASMTAWAACVLLYDANLALFGVVVAVLVLHEDGVRHAIRPIALFALAPLGAGIAALLLRALGSRPYDQYVPSLGSHGPIRTVGAVLLGPIPPSYLAWDPQGLFGHWTRVELAAGAWRGAIVAIGVLWLLPRTSPRPRTAMTLLGIGVPLWIFPSALLVLSSKYQQELAFGQAYITVFGQVLGVAATLVGLAVALCGAFNRIRPALGVGLASVVALMTGLLAGLTGAANLRVVAHEQPMVRTRALLDDGLAAGVLRAVPAGSTVIGLGRDLNWYPANFLLDPRWFGAVGLHDTGARYDFRGDLTLGSAPCARGANWPHRLCEPAGSHGAWLAVRPTPSGGLVIASRTPDGHVADPEVEAQELWVFRSGDGRAAPLLRGHLPLSSLEWTSRGTVVWKVVASERDWLLFRGRFRAGASRPAASSLDGFDKSVDFLRGHPPQEEATLLGERQLLP